MIKKTNEETFNGTDEIAVVITCHDKYLKYLDDTISHVENQTLKPIQRIIAYDGVDYEVVSVDLRKKYPFWHVIGGCFGSPNPLRNKALEICRADWVVFSDADDFMHKDYVLNIAETIGKGIDNIGILYGDLWFSNGKIFKTPDVHDYWQLRLSNYVSAASAWRVEALQAAGGWQNTACYDDWTVALKITEHGWKTKKLSVPILCRYHDVHRRDDSGTKEMVHKLYRSYAIVTLLSGREDCFGHWLNWIRNEPMPKNTTLFILDNSRSVNFTEMARGKINSACCRLEIQLAYITDDRTCDLQSDPLSRHRHVPGLYNRILPLITEDMVLTLEDDVLPPAGAFFKLINSFRVGVKTGAVSAVYPSRSGENRIVGAFGNTNEVKTKEGDYWRNMLTLDDINHAEGLISVDFIGGGFVLWHNALIKRFLPFRFLNWFGKASGWDSQLSRNIRNAGYSLQIDPSIICEHNFR
jgi:glycosyltransferase involved in cell wall biosynthesis